VKTPEQVGRESWQAEKTRHSVTEVARAGMIEFGEWVVQTLLEKPFAEALRRIEHRIIDIKGGKFE
jgi:hypothetical protein